MVREEASSRRSGWLYLVEQEYSLEERWVDETRDFLSSSSASPALLCSSLTPSICFRALQWQLFTQTALLQPLARHGWILQFCEDKHENVLNKLLQFYSVKLIRTHEGEELLLYDVSSGVNLVKYFTENIQYSPVSAP